MSVEIDDLNKEIQRVLTEYGEDAEEVVSKTIDSVAKEARNIVKKNAPVGARKGQYKKSISNRKEKSKKGQYLRVIYSKDPDYRLTHLLERGHLTRNGTKKAKAIPHFEFGEKYLDDNFEKEVESNLKKIS